MGGSRTLRALNMAAPQFLTALVALSCVSMAEARAFPTPMDAPFLWLGMGGGGAFLVTVIGCYMYIVGKKQWEIEQEQQKKDSQIVAEWEAANPDQHDSRDHDPEVQRLYEEGKSKLMAKKYNDAMRAFQEVEKIGMGPYRNSGNYIQVCKENGAKVDSVALEVAKGVISADVRR